MIDIHAHILPGLDDGAATLTESLDLARTAVAQGVSRIIATPHAMDGVYNTRAADVTTACIRLNQELEASAIPLTVHPGQEIRLTHDTVQAWDRGELLSLDAAGSHILIELPGMFIVDGLLRVIDQLADRGLTTILAHPERNPMIMQTPAMLRDFIFHGAMTQITAASLTGDMGRAAKKTAEKLIKTDTVHFMASDIHPNRKYSMTKAIKYLTKKAGQARVQTILTNPEEVLRSHEDNLVLRRN